MRWSRSPCIGSGRSPWAPGRDIFVVYDRDGLPVPGPSLVPLDTVDPGLDVAAAAGAEFDMTITVLD